MKTRSSSKVEYLATLAPRSLSTSLPDPNLGRIPPYRRKSDVRRQLHRLVAVGGRHRSVLAAIGLFGHPLVRSRRLLVRQQLSILLSGYQCHHPDRDPNLECIQPRQGNLVRRQLYRLVAVGGRPPTWTCIATAIHRRRQERVSSGDCNLHPEQARHQHLQHRPAVLRRTGTPAVPEHHPVLRLPHATDALRRSIRALVWVAPE